MEFEPRHFGPASYQFADYIGPFSHHPNDLELAAGIESGEEILDRAADLDRNLALSGTHSENDQSQDIDA
jgi:hypothetical protein